MLERRKEKKALLKPSSKYKHKKVGLWNTVNKEKSIKPKVLLFVFCGLRQQGFYCRDIRHPSPQVSTVQGEHLLDIQYGGSGWGSEEVKRIWSVLNCYWLTQETKVSIKICLYWFSCSSPTEVSLYLEFLGSVVSRVICPTVSSIITSVWGCIMADDIKGAFPFKNML